MIARLETEMREAAKRFELSAPPSCVTSTRVARESAVESGLIVTIHSTRKEHRTIRNSICGLSLCSSRHCSRPGSRRE
jgi:hypothetical protein